MLGRKRNHTSRGDPLSNADERAIKLLSCVLVMDGVSFLRGALFHWFARFLRSFVCVACGSTFGVCRLFTLHFCGMCGNAGGGWGETNPN